MRTLRFIEPVYIIKNLKEMCSDTEKHFAFTIHCSQLEDDAPLYPFILEEIKHKLRFSMYSPRWKVWEWHI